MNSVSTYRASIKKGKVLLSVAVKLPENAEVFVIVPNEVSKFNLETMAKKMPHDYTTAEVDLASLQACWKGSLVMPAYIPEKGDFVAITFDPQSGHEQKGWRPGIVISNRLANN